MTIGCICTVIYTMRVGREIKLNLLEQFYPADSDWQAMVWLRTWQIWERGLTVLPTLRA